ncbi:g2082 [Coccomyxa elongata]
MHIGGKRRTRQGAEEAQKQCLKAEGCRDQKQLEAVIRQLKAVERELRRHSETGRALRRHVKQRQVCRARQRTDSIAFYQCEEEVAGDPAYISPQEMSAEWLQQQGAPWQYFDKQGWKIVATCHPKSCRYYGWSDQGRFLAYNIHRREVMLSEYSSGGGCSSCGYGAIGSEDAIMSILDKPAGNPRQKPFVASAEEFLDYAQRLVDPAMTHRQAMPEDVGYQSLVTLYTMYILFYFRVARCLYLHGREQVGIAHVAAWTLIEWTQHKLDALVRLQAAWRGWHFRQRVLYSPHTELGRRYLLRAWNRECSSQI